MRQTSSIDHYDCAIITNGNRVKNRAKQPKTMKNAFFKIIFLGVLSDAVYTNKYVRITHFPRRFEEVTLHHCTY